LPLEPDALSRAACPTGERLSPGGARLERWSCLNQLLTKEAAGPELRAAAFEALSRLPGVALVGRQVPDRKGRPGIGIALSGEDGSTGPVRDVVIYDPATSRALSFERTKTGLRRTPELDMEPPEALGLVVAQVYLASGTTRSTSERP
jgi:hypothetical protein